MPMLARLHTVRDHWRQARLTGVAELIARRFYARRHPRQFRRIQLESARALSRLGLCPDHRRDTLRPRSCWQPEKMQCVIDCLRRTEPLPGDIVELGVFKGGGTLLLAELLAELQSSRRVHAFDSFEGFPEIDEQDRTEAGDMYAERVDFACTSREEVQATLELFGVDQYAHVYKGRFEHIVPRTFTSQNDRFSLVIIDCDLYQGSRFCLEFFYPRVPSGGIVILDDYGLPSELENVEYPGVRRATDAFLADKPEELQHGGHSMWYFVKA